MCDVLAPYQCHSSAPAASISDLQAEAANSYADRDFSAATQKLNELVENDPTSSRWHEMRAQVLVDGKNFRAAVDDFDAALQEVPGDMLPGCLGHCRATCSTAMHVSASMLLLTMRLLRITSCWPGMLLSLAFADALLGPLTRLSRQTCPIGKHVYGGLQGQDA